jgi:hypothetical protein
VLAGERIILSMAGPEVEGQTLFFAPLLPHPSGIQAGLVHAQREGLVA